MIVHFASETDCSTLAKLFPNEVWPLVLMWFSQDHYERVCYREWIETRQEEAQAARMAKDYFK